MTCDARQILVVQPQRATRRVVARALAQDGFAVSTIARGRAALELCTQRRFDLIVVDTVLAGMPGTNRATPVVVLSERADEAAEDDARAAGACAFVATPVHVDDVVRVIRRALSL